MTADRIDAADLVRALRAAGLDATWEQTGGGVGTVHVGPWAHAHNLPPINTYGVTTYQGREYPFPACLVGPGDYYPRTLTTWELAVGPDESYDPTAYDPAHQARPVDTWDDGQPVALPVIVAAVAAHVTDSLRRWTANPSIIRLDRSAA